MSNAVPGQVDPMGAERFQIDDCAGQSKALREGKIEMQALTKGHYPGKRMHSNVLPGLINIGFWNCRVAQDWGLNFHHNEGLEIVFLETGTMGFEVDGTCHALKAGNLTITRPWQLHKLGNPNIGRSRLCWLIMDVGVRRPDRDWSWPSWVVLDPRDLEELTRTLRQGDSSVWVATPRIREVFRDLAHCVSRWEKPGVTSRLAVAVNRLFVELLEVLARQQLRESPELVTRRRSVELFLQELSENPTSAAEPWTLESMADHCGIGITTMAKYCRELVNNGPTGYLNLCRLEHAARALRERREDSITEIALWAGFNSSQYFATAFLRQFQMTPSRWRELGNSKGRI